MESIKKIFPNVIKSLTEPTTSTFFDLCRSESECNMASAESTTTNEKPGASAKDAADTTSLAKSQDTSSTTLSFPLSPPTNMFGEQSTTDAGCQCQVTESPSPVSKRKKKRRRIALTTMAPVITTTADPTTIYERKVFQSRVTDEDLHKLKEALRAKYGFPLVEKRTPQVSVDIRKPPKKPPKSNTTSRRRMEVQRHKLIVRCTNIIRMLENYNRMSELPEEESRCMFGQLRSEIMSRTTDEMDLEMEQQDLTNLRNLAEREKNNVIECKENKVSKFRFQHSRGQPIISSYFRENFEGYQKPPFFPAHGQFKIKSLHLPKIDKDHEIWLVPIEDNEVPTVPKKKKCDDPNDKRSKREKARPPLKKKGKRVVRDTSKQRTEEADNTDGTGIVRKRKPRPPWKAAKPQTCLYI